MFETNGVIEAVCVGVAVAEPVEVEVALPV